jgi:tRNA A22 N-methylase
LETVHSRFSAVAAKVAKKIMKSWSVRLDVMRGTRDKGMMVLRGTSWDRRTADGDSNYITVAIPTSALKKMLKSTKGSFLCLLRVCLCDNGTIIMGAYSTAYVVRMFVSLRTSNCFVRRYNRQGLSFLQTGRFSSPLENDARDSANASDDFMRTSSALSKAQEAFATLARQGKTWKRLSHMVDMAIGTQELSESNLASSYLCTERNIVDVGTDHGLLALGLALSGRFSRVIGVDVSKEALEKGALTLLDRVQIHFDRSPEFTRPETDGGYGRNRLLLNTSIEFRLGDGLRALECGEAEIICIAGMGVNTMIRILEQKRSHKGSSYSELDRIKCKQLILQPANSKPRHLMFLYKKLQDDGWRVRNERIEMVSSRWYMTTCFERAEGVSAFADDLDKELEVFPGSVLSAILENSRAHPMLRVFDDYCRHHERWIQQDAAFGRLDPLDSIWLKRFGKQPI